MLSSTVGAARAEMRSTDHVRLVVWPVIEGPPEPIRAPAARLGHHTKRAPSLIEANAPEVGVARGTAPRPRNLVTPRASAPGPGRSRRCCGSRARRAAVILRSPARLEAAMVAVDLPTGGDRRSRGGTLEPPCGLHEVFGRAAPAAGRARDVPAARAARMRSQRTCEWAAPSVIEPERAWRPASPEASTSTSRRRRRMMRGVPSRGGSREVALACHAAAGST